MTLPKKGLNNKKGPLGYVPVGQHAPADHYLIGMLAGKPART